MMDSGTVTREWLIPLAISSLIPTTIIVLAMVRNRIERRHGKPAPPDVVKYLQRQIDTASPVVDLKGFVKVGIINGRQLHRQRAVVHHGKWDVEVECDKNGELIAFEAVFQSPASAFLFTKIRGTRKSCRLLKDIDA